MNDGPHAGQPALAAGAPLAHAQRVLVMVHGRGASAEDMLGLARELPNPTFAYLAPQAAGFSWYPHSFLAPLERNEPYLSSALALLEAIVGQLRDAGIGQERVMLLGFSQGACLVLEFAARHADRFLGLVGLSGGLIGPPDTGRQYDGELAGTPVLLGCSDVDPHVPRERVDETAEVLAALGGEVTKRIYPGMGHTVNQDEIEIVRTMMGA